MKAIIYLTRNVVNGKIYVGSTIRPENEKYFGSGIFLINAIKKYGKENFMRITLEECSPEEKSQREEHWISVYESYKREIGYNISKKGVGPYEPHSEERKERNRKSNTGLKRTLEQRKNISEGKRGYKMTETHKRNMILAKTGLKWTEEQKEKLREKRKGRKMSDYQKQRISEGKKKSLLGNGRGLHPVTLNTENKAKTE
jgi:group I intron endonuclease